MNGKLIFLLLMTAVFINDVIGQAQVYSQVGGTANVVIQLPDQNTQVISPSGQTMVEVGFFGPPTVSAQYQNRVTVSNYSGGFGTPSISLTFTGVQLTDAGQFQCTSTFGGNTQCGPTLVVLGAPSLPTFTVVPDPVIVGNDVDMTCSATSTSRPPSPNLVLVYVLKQNGNVITQPRTSSFLIKGVSTDNKDDIFQCAAYELNTVTNELTGLLSADSDPYTLDPNFAPTDIKADPATPSYTLNRDTPIPDISCDASCNPSCDFGWYKAPDDQIVAQGKVLSLGTVTSEEAGTYICKATNSLGEKLLPIKIDVQESLGDISFEPAQDSYTVLEGATIPGILCNADCVPACKLDWLRDGRFLYESEGIDFGQVSRADSDTYTCRANNDKGSKEKNLVLDVQYPPDNPVLSPAALGYELEENAAVIPDVSCQVDCNPDCKVEWFKDGEPNSISQDRLSLGTATRLDTGTYQCRASNLFGRVSSDPIKIQIFYRPENMTFTPPNPTYDIEEGETLAPIKCQAQCNPTCTFQWYKGSDFSTPVSPSDVLDLSTADLEDSGQWTCVAKNTYGELQRQISVAVSFGPKAITLTPPRASYDAEANVGVVPDILCSTPCNPQCSFQWLKNSAPVSSSPSPTLSLGTVKSSDEGVYTCRASNRLGTLTKDVDVQVNFGPSSSIVLSPDQTVYDVNAGSDLKVTCSATCDPACSFRWVKNGNVEYSSSGDLNIRQMGVDDEGIYECIADNNVGSPASRKITVNVQDGPSQVTINPRGPLSLKEGTDFLVTCTASCTPACDLTWTKDSNPVSSVGGVLSLNGIEREMGGVYICTASNEIGSQTGKIQVGVVYGPGETVQLIPDLDPFQVEEGGDFEISCSADCNPACGYTWARGRNYIGEGPTLRLPSVDRSDTSIITCLANNEAQTPNFKSTTFEVMYGPGSEPNIFPGEAVKSVDRGDDFQARCDADCYPACQIDWYLDGRKLETSTGILTITGATMQDQGDYMCQAENTVGTASRKLTLQVEAGPGTSVRFDPPGGSQTAKEGSSKIVTCMADCSPSCSYHWKMGSTNISNTAVLSLNPVARQDGGVYTCVASNSQDSLSSKQLDLTVQYGPEGTTRLIPASIASLDVGDSLNLFCVAECSPACSYTWFLGQRAIPSSSGELQVESVKLSDGGTYSCQADNGIDEKETVNIDVNIQSGPAGSITFNPPNDTVTLTEGTALQMACQADCTPSCFYVWSKGSRTIPSTNGMLGIPALTTDDIGDYTCVAANGEGDQASKVFTVDVLYGPGSSMELVPPGKVQTLNEGASFQVSCRSDCNPACNHTWYFVNTPVTTSSVLSLVSLSKGDQGSYKCVASNGVGLSSEQDVLIQVQTGPGNSVRIDPPVGVYQIHEGKPLMMTCSAVCSPACTYTWFYGADRFKAPNGTFSQPSATRDLSGSYVCYASNDVAVQGSRQIQVDVLYGPSDGVVLDPPENQQIEIGDSLTLRCSATCNPDCEYHWFKGSKKLPSVGGRLRVGPATEMTSGDYYCRASNEVEGMDSDSITIDVLKGPGDSISFTPDVPNLDMPEFGSVTVACKADCIPACSYTWKRGLEDVMGGQAGKNGSLTLSNVMRDDPSLYVCYASNGVGLVASKNLQLNVQYGPKESVSIFPPMTTVEPKGGIVSLSCKASCNPDCDIKWKKGSTMLPSVLGILTLTNVQASDAGNYTCMASNLIGVEMAQTTVDIVSNTGSTIEFSPPEVSPKLQEGDKLSVRCAVDCLPACEITWRKDGQMVGNGEMLEIENVKRTDGGIYSCMADNSLGTKLSRLLSLDVTYGPGISPSLVPPLTRQELQVGQPLISRCEAECNPPCRLDWLKNGQFLSEVQNGYLLLPTVTPADAGSYTCVADNGIGQPTVTNMNVSVSFGPVDGEVSFSPPDRYRYVLDGQPFTVRCQADCMPACSFSWYIGNRKYESNDGSLTLDPVTRDDVGTYTCLASNGVGKTQTKDLDIFVEFKPSKPALDPPDTLYQPVKGQSLSPVTCQADCNPRCDFQWVKDGLILSNRGVLELRMITSGTAGMYTCVATNVHGRSETSLEIQVNYPPIIQVFTVGNRKYMATVKENAQASLYCKVDSMPLASIGFFNGSQLLYAEDNADELSYSLQKASCYDTGNYTCVASNGVGQTQEMTVQLDVLCSPRVDPRMPKKPEVTGMIGGTASITVPIVANPPASFLWYKKKGSGGVKEVIDVTGKPGKSRGESEMFFYVNDSSSTLVIKNIQEEDFGQYVVNMVNEEGASTITFDLVDETKVSEPLNGDVDSMPILLGVGIGLGFLVGAGITVIVVSTRCKPKQGGHKDSSIDDWKSDTTYDTLYLRDALWAQRHMKLGSCDTYRSSSIPYNGVDLRQPDDTTVRYDHINAMKPTEMISSVL